MKKTLLLLAMVLGVFSVYAQVDLDGLDGKKAMKKAQRAYNSYNVDQTNKSQDLLDAREYIDFAVKQDEVKGESKLWSLMGQVYNALVGLDQTKALTDPSYTAQHGNAGMIAFQAYKKVLEIEPGDKGALSALVTTIGSITNAGLTSYENLDYNAAFNAFRSVLDIHKLLKENDAESPFDVEAELDNQHYITGLAAMNSGQKETALSYFQPLFDKQYDKPAVYDAMYQLKVDDDVNAAEKILSQAREKYPDDTGLLFAEINHYLKLQKIDVLEEKLKQAIEIEPNNPSLYSTMGNIYDRQYQAAYKEQDTVKAAANFQNAIDYYNKAVEIKPDYTDAIYSIGALFYNKAAIYQQEMNALADDYSKAGTAKYNKKKEQVESMFDQALPYLKRVESMDPADRNTLIALKEIYARQNDFDMSNIFKERLEKVEAGETVEESYFKE